MGCISDGGKSVYMACKGQVAERIGKRRLSGCIFAELSLCADGCRLWEGSGANNELCNVVPIDY